MKSSNRRRVIGQLLITVLLASLVGVGVVWVVSRSQKTQSAEIPSPDFTAANAEVVAATEGLRQEVVKLPDSAAAWGQYGKILMAHEWNDEALSSFSQAAKLDPTDMQWPYLSGVLLDRDEPSEAVQAYLRASELAPDYAPLRLRMGRTLLRLNRVDEAEATLKKASELAGTEPQPWIALSRVAATRGDWKVASELLERAVQVAPQNREARVELTRAKLMLGTANALSREEQRALLGSEKYEAMPDPVWQSVNAQEVAARSAATQADQAAAQGDLAKAIDTYVKLIQQRPELIRPRLNLAAMYMNQGQIPLATITLREVTRLFPADPMGHYALSNALEASQQFDAAMQEREEAVRLKPDYAEAHFTLGLSAERNGDTNGAIDHYRRAVQCDPRLAQAHLALGIAYQKQGKIDEAVDAMQSAVRLAPGDPVPQNFLSKALELRKEKVRSTPRDNNENDTLTPSEPTDPSCKASDDVTVK